MTETLEAAIKALSNPHTTEVDRRLWQEIAKRGIVYASEKHLIQLRYLLPNLDHGKKPS